MSNPQDALLLIGPTGSGKSPLGDALEAHGFSGKNCYHFDFGANLRRAVETDGASAGLARADVDYLQRVLKEGALLERETFHIAAAILTGFLRERRVGDGDFLVLNGLPRHVGQAEDLGGYVNMKLVVNLDCPADVVYQRIRLNSGGDRTGRCDDTPADVTKKLEIFRERTTPLLDFYQSAGVPVVHVEVTTRMSSGEVIARMTAPGTSKQ